MFNPDKLHFIMDEIIIDGIVISTDVEETCAELEARRKAPKTPKPLRFEKKRNK